MAVLKFISVIYKIGINPVVDPPENVLAKIFEQASRSSGPIPVRGKINGAEYTQTLVKYQGAWRLYINGPMLKASGLGVGDKAGIEIEFDPRPRETPMPKEFRDALKTDKKAKAEFEALAPSRQKEVLRYLGNLKSPDALVRNIENMIKQLSGKPVDKPHIALRATKKG